MNKTSNDDVYFKTFYVHAVKFFRLVDFQFLKFDKHFLSQQKMLIMQGLIQDFVQGEVQRKQSRPMPWKSMRTDLRIKNKTLYRIREMIIYWLTSKCRIVIGMGG